MKLASALIASTVAIGAMLAGCSSDSTPTVGTPANTDNGGVTGNGVGSASSAPDTNPAGVKYPTDNIGTVPGKTIKNFKFLGYPDAHVAGGLQPISLAQYFDPTGATTRMIHIQAAGTWCSACQGETTALVPIASDLKARKVVWLVTLVEGAAVGTPSTKNDLDKWIQRYNSPFTHLLDPENANLGPFFSASELPWNGNIDATTMTIITAGEGGAQTGGDILADLDDALTKVK